MNILWAVLAAIFAPVVVGSDWAWAEETGRAVKSTVLTSEEAVLRALQAAPILRARAEGLNVAAGTLTQAASRPNPEIELEVENFGVENLAGDGISEITLTLAQRIERRSKRRNRVAAAQSDLEIARLEFAITRLDLIRDVQLAFVKVTAASARLANAEDSVTMAKELSAAVRHRARNARDPEAAEYRAEVQLLQAVSRSNRARSELDIAKRSLALHWVEQDASYYIDGMALFVVPNLEPVSEINNVDGPDLAFFAVREDRARKLKRLEIAHGKQDPTIRLGARSFEDTDDVAGIISFSMPFALFDTNRGNIARARAEERQAGWETRQARIEYERERLTLRQTFEAQRNEAKVMNERLVPAAERALVSIRRGFDRGAFSFLEVLDAQRALLEQQSDEIALLEELHLTIAHIDRLTARYRHPLSGEERNQ